MKNFTIIEKSRKDPKLAIATAINQDNHKEMLRAICCNSSTGYIVDRGSSVGVAFASYALPNVLKQLESAGFVQQN